MLRLVSRITIETGSTRWQFNSVAECNIVEDMGSLTDTCELKLPRNIKWQGQVAPAGNNKEMIYPPIKRGDRIMVELGYDDDLVVRFAGYIRSVDAKVPVTITCEDGMFLLKSIKAEPKAFKNASLKEIIEHLLKGTNIAYKLIDDNIQVGAWRITQPSVSQELQELKDKVMLSSYFRFVEGQSVLYIGLEYPIDNREKHLFKHGKNIIKEDFTYRNKEDIRVRVEAQSFNAKHRKITYEYGDKDGDVIKIRIDGLSEEELKKYAMQALDRYKQSGFKGSFETFGTPEVRKCDVVEIHASDGNRGTYLVKKNEISFGTNGYRQKIELGNTL